MICINYNFKNKAQNINMELLKDLQSCFKNLITTEDEIFSDYTVVAENKTFPCHRFVLAACSQFFRGLFRSDMQEKHRQSFILKDIAYETFKLIYEFIYFNDNGLTEENILDVWMAADFLQIDFIVLSCHKFVMDTMNEINCHRYFVHAKLLDNYFMGKILKHITCHFDQFKDSECVMELEGEELLSIVRDPDLNTSTEDNVVETILQWVSHSANDKCHGVTLSETSDKDVATISSDITSMSISTDNDNTRISCLAALLKVSKLVSLSQDYLREFFANPLILENESVSDIVSLSVGYRLGYRPKYWPALASNRKCSQWEDVVLMPCQVKFIAVFSMLEKKMIGKLNLSALPYGAVLIERKEEIYACGYTANNKDSLSIFHLFGHIWRNVANMQLCDNMNPQDCEFQAEQQSLLCFSIQSCLYIVNTNSGIIYTWDFQNYGKLKQLTFVPSGMSIVYVTSYKQSMLVICGTLNGSAQLNFFETVRKEWLGALPIEGICVQGITSFDTEKERIDEELYFLTSHGEIFLLDTEAGGFTFNHVTTISNFNLSVIGALVYCGDLFLFVRESTSDHETCVSDIQLPLLFKQVHVIGVQYPCASFAPVSIPQYTRDSLYQ